MTALTYLDFELGISRTASGYRVRGRDGRGREAAADFTPPIDAAELAGFWSAPPGGLERLGGRLFEAVFGGELLACLRAALEETGRKRTGLRLRLGLDEAPELAGLPWEYLYDPVLRRFLALSARTPVVRTLGSPEPVRPLAVRGPLKVLVMLSRPRDYPELAVEEEWRRLRQALGGLVERGRVDLERMETATLGGLRRRLRQGEVHVFHFVGHGGFGDRSEEGVLVLEDEDGRGVRIPGSRVGMVLHDHVSLRLAVLGSCHGACASPADPWSGVAQGLVLQGVPAVVAMQSRIDDTSAVSFAAELYGALAEGSPVDAGLGEARRALAADDRPEWGVPVLYLRSPDGRLFDVGTAPAEVHPAPEPSEKPKVRVFVSYSREDADYLGEVAFLQFLRGLEREGIEVWSDRQIAAGDLRRQVIRQQIEDSHLALVLVSQAFLDSESTSEVRALLARESPVVPVILSPCDWRRWPWLEERRVLPGEEETVEEHYTEPGRRKRLFLEVREELRRRAEEVRAAARG